jgi:hypothetical protein
LSYLSHQNSYDKCEVPPSTLATILSNSEIDAISQSGLKHPIGNVEKDLNKPVIVPEIRNSALENCASIEGGDVLPILSEAKVSGSSSNQNSLKNKDFALNPNIVKAGQRSVNSDTASHPKSSHESSDSDDDVINADVE